MPHAEPTRAAFRWAPATFGVLAGLVVAVAPLAQGSSQPWIFQPGASPIPMAPLTAVMILGLAAVLVGQLAATRFRFGQRLLQALLLAQGLLQLLIAAGMVAGPGAPLGRALLWAHQDFTRVSPLTLACQTATALALAYGGGFLGPGWRRRQTGAIIALIPLTVGSVIGLSYAAGAPLFYGSLAVPMSLPAAAGSCLVASGALALCGCDTWPLALFARHNPDRTWSSAWYLRRPLPLFLALALPILVLGSLYRKTMLAEAKTTAQSELAAIAELKAKEIARWYQNRLLDARQLSSSPLLQDQFRLALAAPAQPQTALLGWMQDLKGTGYSAVLLFDGQGRIRLSTGPESVQPADQITLANALSSGTIQIHDLHRAAPDHQVQLDLWIPVRSGARVLGALLLRVDAEDFLFPMVRAWPTASRSAETLLVRREGDRVRFLNGLRHTNQRPMEGSLTLADHPNLPAAQAALGREGFMEGLDYRGVPVLSGLRRVPATPWALVVKVDQVEIYQPLQLRNGLTVAAMMATVLVLALGLGFLLRSQDARRILDQLTLERERQGLAERFQALMHQANDIILLLGPDGRILEANARAEEAYGLARNELEGLPIRRLRAPETLASLDSSFQATLHGKPVRMETVHVRQDGSSFPVEVSSRAVRFGGETFVLSFIRDITERHRQDVALQRMYRLYAALSQVNQAIVWSADPSSLFAKICEVLVQFGGFKMVWIGRADPASQRVLPICHHGMAHDYFQSLDVRSDTSPRGQGPAGRAIRENRPVVFNDFLADEAARPWREAALQAGFGSVAGFPVSQDEAVAYVLVVYAQDRDFFGSEEIALLTEAAMDVSFALGHLAQEQQREQAEAALRRNETRLKNLTDSAPDLILALDAQGRLRYRNRPSPGQTEAASIGQDWLEDFAPEHRNQADQARQAALTSGQIQEFEWSGPGADGQLRHFQARLCPISSEPGGDALVVFSTDITQARKALAEQAHLEAQLAQAQKLESLGSLAGGVAHDMNNVLGAILSLASAQREQAATGAPLAGALDTIVSACLRGRGVVKSLLYFAHKDLEQVSALDLNALVRDMVQLLAYTTLKRIKLEMRLEEGLGALQGDSGALSHTLMNLCVNAMDAMPGGGCLTLSTAAEPGGGLSLCVQDNGHGMSEEVQKKALEPFFTTKPLGKGTGLGLSMAYATLKAHDGTLELESAPGAGTRVLLRFPASRVQPALAAPVPAPAPPPAPGGPWRILLVDDDELIRDSVAPMLSLLGHQVDTAAGGLEALAQFEAGLEVDLVILDMNMPGLNGAETLPALLAIRPEQRVLMATGYSDQDIAGLLDGHPNVFSIRKPFSLSEIRAKFQEVLGGSAGRA